MRDDDRPALPRPTAAEVAALTCTLIAAAALVVAVWSLT